MSDNTKVTYSDLRMEPANNGVIISWCERHPAKNGKDTYSADYKYPKEVFDFDGDNDLDAAFSKFKEIWMKQYSTSIPKAKTSY